MPLETLTAYLVRLAPGLVFWGAMFWTLHKHRELRIVLYILLFVLIRDAMTPVGIWSFGNAGVFWLRFRADGGLLLLLGASSLALSLILGLGDRPNAAFFRWIEGNPLTGMGLGIAGALLSAGPLLLVYRAVPLASRGGAFPAALLPALLWLTLTGNLLEELLFRGYVLGWLKRRHSTGIAALLSGVIFAGCHILLATSVSDAGFPLLLYATWEGAIAGLVGDRRGLIPAMISHGGAVFLLAAALF
ncbi:MAG: CPBP family intramembrane metalloprotease [Anaerolineae bacterium]|nr:CPBP family intramembrane metalloprotease [Anaerolineae bacterium]